MGILGITRFDKSPERQGAGDMGERNGTDAKTVAIQADSMQITEDQIIKLLKNIDPAARDRIRSHLEPQGQETESVAGNVRDARYGSASSLLQINGRIQTGYPGSQRCGDTGIEHFHSGRTPWDPFAGDLTLDTPGRFNRAYNEQLAHQVIHDTYTRPPSRLEMPYIPANETRMGGDAYRTSEWLNRQPAYYSRREDTQQNWTSHTAPRIHIDRMPEQHRRVGQGQLPSQAHCMCCMCKRADFDGHYESGHRILPMEPRPKPSRTDYVHKAVVAPPAARDDDEVESWAEFFSTPQPQETYKTGKAKSLPMAAQLHCIPNFAGESEHLGLFCTAIRRVAKDMDTEEQKGLLLYVANKLKGRAAEHLFAMMDKFNDVEEFIKALEEKYVSSGSAEIFRSQLKTIVRRKEETIDTYAQRVRKLTNKLLTMYDCSPDMEPRDKESRKREVALDARENFLFGLGLQFEGQVRSRNPKTLDEAVKIAIEFENLQYPRIAMDAAAGGCSERHLRRSFGVRMLEADEGAVEERRTLEEAAVLLATAEASRPEAQRQSPSRPAGPDTLLTCGYCKGARHTEEECRRKKRDSLRCDYCNKSGHSISGCWTRRDRQLNDVLNRLSGISGPNQQRSAQNQGPRDRRWGGRDNYGDRRDYGHDPNRNRGYNNSSNIGPPNARPPSPPRQSQDARAFQNNADRNTRSGPLN